MGEEDFYICLDCLYKISEEALDVRTYIEVYLPLPDKNEEEEFFHARLMARCAAVEILKELVTNDESPQELLVKYMGKQYELIKKTNNMNDIYDFEICISVAEDIVNYLKIL